MDTFGKRERSRIMAAVRSKNTRSTEWRLRGALIALQVRGWSCQAQDLPGKPDFIFEDNKIAVFVDGCFWHGCHKCYRRPQSNREYWDQKVARNIKRDRRASINLRRLGWKVIRIQEHEIARSPKACIERIKKLQRV